MKIVGAKRSSRSAIAPFPSPDSRPIRQPRPAWDRHAWLVVIPLALVVLYAFFPAYNNGFVAWDDDRNFLGNPHFRGLGAAQVKWAWTTFLADVYQPLAWMVLETEYVFFQLNPRRYHVTSVLLQVASAVVLYILTMALLNAFARAREGEPPGEPRHHPARTEPRPPGITQGHFVRSSKISRLENPWVRSVSAALATALFSVHPLRAEAVAWVSCQPYLPCILFCMLSVLAYLQASTADPSSRWGWLAGSFFLFVTALLFKAVAVSLPVVLLILDVYPLGRFWDSTGRWLRPSARRALLEKVPFMMVSLLFVRLAFAARTQSPFVIEQYDASVGIAQACYAVWFYIVKTLLPLSLAAMYPLPKDLNWLVFPYDLAVFATLLVTGGLVFMGRRWPGLLAAWLSYLVILAPNSGLVRNNSIVIAADRYSYMAMLGGVIVTAGCFSWLWRLSSQWNRGAAAGIITVGLGALVVLVSLTRNQCRTWLNSETLWAHAVSHGANSSVDAHDNFGVVLFTNKKYKDAEVQFLEALRLGPRSAKVHTNFGATLLLQRRYREAEPHLTEAARLDPGNVMARFSLGVLNADQGKYEAAAAHYFEALRLDPSHAVAHKNLGLILSSMGKYDGAMAQLTQALQLNSRYADAHNGLGTILSRHQRYAEALAHFAAAIKINQSDPNAYNESAMIMAACPEARLRDGKKAVEFATRACELTGWRNPLALDTLAAARAELGDFDAAISSQKKAIELLTDERQIADFGSRLALYKAKRPYRQEFLTRLREEARP